MKRIKEIMEKELTKFLIGHNKTNKKRKRKEKTTSQRSKALTYFSYELELPL
jgi:hypothetical protein